VEGFDGAKTESVCNEFLNKARSSGRILPINWNGKYYWFTSGTLKKYERLRYVARDMGLNETRDGRAILLSYALSVRRCSRADQRSPKPFISKIARENRSGTHFDPISDIQFLFGKVRELYGKPYGSEARVFRIDLTSPACDLRLLGRNSHVITSPPYINAQDYFRNFKLELYLLEELLPFRAEEIKCNFIGTEKGKLVAKLGEDDLSYNRSLLPVLSRLETAHPHHAAIVHRYLFDMGKCFDKIGDSLEKGGVFVIVCGDNLVAGVRIPTWKLLSRLLEARGFSLFDRFGDKIECRNLPPNRKGHKGLIKREIISAFLKP
jgi:hypothetical protein